ncbi:MAG: phage tail assembly protein [Methylophaga sp.]|nr:phage tail assembly protein [Methylophaga sp.]
MAQVKVTLQHGLKVGDITYKQAVLREAIAGDIMEAQEDSEKLMMVPTAEGGVEAQFVVSPALMTGHVLRRQIKCIDDHQGPLDLAELKKLHPSDLNLLLDAQQKMDNASNNTLKEVATRGRTDSDSEAD